MEDVEDFAFVIWFRGPMELPDKAHGTIVLFFPMFGSIEQEFLMLGGESYWAALGDRSFEPADPDFTLVGDFLGLLRHLRVPVAVEPFSNLVREQDVTLSETEITFLDLELEQDVPLSETIFYQITFVPELIDLEERYHGVKGLSGTLLIHQDSLLPYRLTLNCEGCPPLASGVVPVLEYVLTRFDEPVVIPSAQDQPNADDHGDAASVATSFLVGQEVDGTIGLDDDVDFFSFQAEAGRTYAIIGGSTSQGFVANPTLYDTDGHLKLASYDRDGHGPPQIVWDAPSTGTYYVAVDGLHDVGRYIITVTTAGSTPDAAPLILGQELAGDIAFYGDVDFFSFQAEGGRTYALNVGIPGRFDSVVTLYDTDGTSELTSNAHYAGRTLGSQIVWEAPSTGTYYVAVSGDFWEDLGYYTINAKAAVSLVPGGPVIGISDPTLSYIEQVKFQLTNASQSGDAVNLLDWRIHPAYAGYHDDITVVCHPNIDWSVGWPTGSGPMLEPGETVEITVDHRFESPPLEPCSEFVIDIEPTVGVMLTLRVKVPSDLTPVMELITEFRTPGSTDLTEEAPVEPEVEPEEVVRELTTEPAAVGIASLDPTRTAIAVSARGAHTCVLTTAGGIKCWGRNTSGELGDGSITLRAAPGATPVDVTGLSSGMAAVSAGGAHTCAVTTAGGLKCWGSNNNGQLGDGTTIDRNTPVEVTGLSSGVAAVSAGGAHTCAVTTAGGVKCWGVNVDGQLGDGTTTARATPGDVTGLTSGVAAVSAGFNHTCVLTTAGGVKCWGHNGYGGLGDATFTERTRPVDVTGLRGGVAAVSAGGRGNHTCAVTTAGGLKCWGGNHPGQLGDGTTIDRNTPVDVTGLSSGVAAVSAGSFRTCAVTTAGGLKCWGFGIATTPVDIVGLTSGVAAVSTRNHTCAVTTAGGVNCWGSNNDGELGDGTLTHRSTPTDVIGFLGAGLSIEMSASAEVVTVGDHLTYTIKVTNNGPATFTGVTLIDTLPASMDFVSVISTQDICTESEGTVTCDIGELAFGAVATGTIVVIPTAEDKMINTATVAAIESDPMLAKNTATQTTFVVRAFAPATSTAVSAGRSHTCAVTTAGGVKCWGLNENGQLGDGSTTNRTTPVDVVGLTSGVADVAAGTFHTCAVTTAGGVKCWGVNVNGELGDGTTTKRATPVDVVGLTSGVADIATWRFHTCAVTTAGGLNCWGSTPLDVVGLTSGVADVAGGGNHTCAVTTAGGLKCWGSNNNGQLGDRTTIDRNTPVEVTGLSSGVAAVSAGGSHTCAVTAAGGLRCWGQNWSGQLGDGTGVFGNFSATPVDVVGLTSGVADVSAGRAHTCAVTTAGGVKCWGLNNNGQLGDGTTIDRNTPVDVTGLTSGVAAVSTWGAHTCAVTTAGGVKCWGLNASGQLGDGTTTDRATPVDVLGLPLWPTSR